MDTKKSLEEQLMDKNFRDGYNYYQPDYELGSTLICYRIDYGLTSKELAKKLGISKRKLNEIESMNGNPSLKLMKKIAEMLDSNLQVTFKKKE